MKTRLFTLLSLIVTVALLVPGGACPTVAQSRPPAPIVPAPATAVLPSPQPAEAVRSNIHSLASPAYSPYDDEFDSPNLDPKWAWVREDPSHWSLTENPGHLRIVSQYGGFSGGFDVKNILIQPAPAGDFEATTEVAFLPTGNWQTATIIAYQDDRNFFYIGRRYHGGCSVAGASWHDGHLREVDVPVPCDLSPTRLRIIKGGNMYRGLYQDEVGTWVQVCEWEVGISADYLGLEAHNGHSSAAEIPADFDFIHVTLAGSSYFISGRVTDGGDNPISGVTVSAGSSGSATTDANGYYTITGLITGTYTLTPSRSGWAFSPSSRTVSVPPNATGQDFIATSSTLRIVSDASWRVSATPVPGWETADFDDSSWDFTVAPAPDACGWVNCWYDPDVFTMWSEVQHQTIYLRKSFFLESSATVISATIKTSCDDDHNLYINGTLVASDWDGVAGPTLITDIKAHLRTGANVIAIKANDTFGVCRSMCVDAVIVFEPGPTPGLVYTGRRYLPDFSVLISEADGRITMGDHVHLQLPFENTSSEPISNATVEVVGEQQEASSPGVYIYDGVDWSSQQTVQLTPTTIGPGEEGVADFWIYVTNNDPTDRQTLGGETWLQVRTGSGEWMVRLVLSPVQFDISGNDTLQLGSCLHNPGNFEIQRYAQYAAGALAMSIPPNSDGDPDTPEQAVRNLVARVREEYDYNNEAQAVQWAHPRVPDTMLLRTRDSAIGVCRHYADLTTGLLRSLGIPTRYTTAVFRESNGEIPGHAWVEFYTGANGWRQADSAWNAVFQEGIYEERGHSVEGAWADRYPMADSFYNHCVPSCWGMSMDCSRCLEGLDNWRDWPGGCTEDVRSRYHNVGLMAMQSMATGDDQVLVDIQSPIFVTRTLPFTVSAGLVNSTTQTLDVLTATLSIYEDISSTVPLYNVSPAYHTASSLAPDGAITVTWTVTPLVSGINLPLRVAAFTGDLFSFDERPLVVNEPGTPPPLILGGLCGPGSVQPSEPLTLTAYVLDETLQPLTDTLTTITATLYATPTLGYSATVPLTLDTDGFFRSNLSLPMTATLGTYHVIFTATRPSYQVAKGESYFFVAAPLTMTLEVTPTVVVASEPLTLTAQVYERGSLVAGAAVYAEIATPGGVVTVPLVSGGDVYTMAFRPIDLEPNLGGAILDGQWEVFATAGYYGNTTAASATTTVNISPSDVTIAGLAMGVVQTGYTFTATVSPDTATLPITYTWQATGLSPVTRTSSLTVTDVVTFTWITTGTQTITVTVTNIGGMVTGTHSITLYTPVQTDFVASPTSGFAPLTVVFTNTSTGDYATSLWDFGDEVTSTQASPTHTYTAAAAYTVTLTVGGPGGTDILTRTNYITVYAPVQADFTASSTSGVAPLTVVFANTSIGDYAESLWDFGDGITGTQTSPTHTYTIGGVYPVALTVSGPGGTDTLTRTHFITVDPAPVQAAFTASPTSGVAPLTVVFTNTSSGEYTTSLWAFGDSVTSMMESPTHIYTTAGVYTVTLMVSGPGGSDTETKAEYMTISAPATGECSIYLPLILRNH